MVLQNSLRYTQNKITGRGMMKKKIVAGIVVAVTVTAIAVKITLDKLDAQLHG